MKHPVTVIEEFLLDWNRLTECEKLAKRHNLVQDWKKRGFDEEFLELMSEVSNKGFASALHAGLNEPNKTRCNKEKIPADWSIIQGGTKSHLR